MIRHCWRARVFVNGFADEARTGVLRLRVHVTGVDLLAVPTHLSLAASRAVNNQNRSGVAAHAQATSLSQLLAVRVSSSRRRQSRL